MFDLSEQVAIVTDSGRGLGKFMATGTAAATYVDISVRQSCDDLPNASAIAYPLTEAFLRWVG